MVCITGRNMNSIAHIDASQMKGEYAIASDDEAPNKEPVHLAFAVCGDRLEQALTLLKSIILFNTNAIVLHGFVEESLQPKLIETVI